MSVKEPVMKRLLAILFAVSVLAASSTFAAGDGLGYPQGNGLRIVATGHSWVAPAMNTLSPIALAAGFEGHHLRPHLAGGGNGSARTIWAVEHGLDVPAGKKERQKRMILLPAIATGQWDVMTWGAFTWDKQEDFTNWIDICLKANPKMVFYLQDGWPRAQEGSRSPGKYEIAKFLEKQEQINTLVK